MATYFLKLPFGSPVVSSHSQGPVIFAKINLNAHNYSINYLYKLKKTGRIKHHQKHPIILNIFSNIQQHIIIYQPVLYGFIIDVICINA